MAVELKSPEEVTPTFEPGTRLGDGARYELRKVIGTGAMAEVYKATDSRLGGRIVAIKTLSRSVAAHPFADRMRQLFIQEASAIARVKDAHVVEVLDFGTADDGTPYMVMEFLLGTDLAQFLKDVRNVEIPQAVDTVLAICAGVHACHLAGIIHRDLKPANIFICRTANGPQPKVLDFSVAKIPLSSLGPDHGQESSTDLIVGTPSYMSPEQALGRPASAFSDQYSIGALLHRCLIGYPPKDLPPRPRDLRPDIPLPLEGVLLRVLKSVPEQRFPTVHDLGRALLPFASPAGRGRWNGYYRDVPIIVDPRFSEPIAPKSAQAIPSTIVEIPAARARPGVGPATGAPVASAYQGTTVLRPPNRLVTSEPAESTKATEADGLATPTSSPVETLDPFASIHRRIREGAEEVTVRVARSLRKVAGPARSYLAHWPLFLPIGAAILIVFTLASELSPAKHPHHAPPSPPQQIERRARSAVAAPEPVRDGTDISHEPPVPLPFRSSVDEHASDSTTGEDVAGTPQASGDGREAPAIRTSEPAAEPHRRAVRHARKRPTYLFAVPLGAYGAPILP